MPVTDHSLLQSLQVLSGLFPSVLLHPAERKKSMLLCANGTTGKGCSGLHVETLRELLQLAALLLVDSLELLVLHPQPFLLQHDLLV